MGHHSTLTCKTCGKEWQYSNHATMMSYGPGLRKDAERMADRLMGKPRGLVGTPGKPDPEVAAALVGLSEEEAARTLEEISRQRVMDERDAKDLKERTCPKCGGTDVDENITMFFD